MFEPNFHDTAYVEPLNLSTDELRPREDTQVPMNDPDNDDVLGIDAGNSIDITNLQLSDWIHLDRYKRSSYAENFFERKKHRPLRESLPYRFNSSRRYGSPKLPLDVPLYLNYHATRTDTVVKWCFPYRYTRNNALLHSVRLKGEDPVRSFVTPEDFEKLRAIVEGNRYKDPESLNDSDLDILMGDYDDDDDDTTETQIPTEQNQQPSSELPRNLPLLDTLSGYYINGLLLVGINYIRLAGQESKTLLRDGINDCCVLNTSNGTLDDILLVVQPSGYLLSVLPRRDNLDIADSARVVQYWNLGTHGDWKIVKHNSQTALEFVLVNYNTQTLKFFKFINHYTFQLTNNLTLTDFKILSCSFFPNYNNNNNNGTTGEDMREGEKVEIEVGNTGNMLPRGSPSHYLLFVPTVRFQHLVYLCIEWDSRTNSRKIVHQLTHLRSEEINGIISLNSNKVLGFSNNTVTMISANQVMSGEVSFTTVKLHRYLRGVKSWYCDMSLLYRLKELNPDEFGKFICCNVVGTSTGVIYACMTNDTDIEFYVLTRFKGLRKISPAPKSDSIIRNPGRYDMVIQSFNRTLNITLKLDGIKKKKVPEAYQNVIKRRTLDITSDDNTRVSVIKGDTWKFSRSSITKVSLASADFLHTVPSVKLQCCFEVLKPIRECNFITTVAIPNTEEWKKFLDINNPEEYQLLLSGDDANGILRVFLYTKCEEDDADILPLEGTELEEPGASKLVELNDILKFGESDGSKANLINLIPVGNLIVYIYKTHAVLESIVSGAYKSYDFTMEIEGVSYTDGILILWGVSDYKLLCLDFREFVQNKCYQTGEDTEFPHFIEKKIFNSVPREESGGKINVNYVKFLEKVLLTTSKGIYSVDLEHFLSDSIVPITMRSFAEDQFFEIPVNQMVILRDKFICLTDGGLLHCFRDTDSFKYFLPLRRLPFKNQDVQLRKLDDDTILAFSSDDIYVVKFFYNYKMELQYKIYNLKLPFSDRTSPILDVVGSGVGDGKICVLFGSGLKIFQKEYISYNYNSYLLRYSRSENKIFRFLHKINRLLVLSCDYRTWNCIKLENGRYLSLPETVLKGSSEIRNVVELPYLNERSTTLIINFEDGLKCVRIVPVGNNIKVQEVCEYKIAAEMHEKIYVNDDNSFYMLRYGRHSATEDSVDVTSEEFLDCFLKIKFDEETQNLVTVSEYPFKGKGQIRDFEVLDNKHIIVTTTKGDSLYLFKDIDKNFNPNRLIKLHIPSDSFVNKIVALNNVCFVAAFRTEGREHYLSSLCFYSVLNTKYSPTGEAANNTNGRSATNTGTSNQDSELLSVFDIHRHDISGLEHHGDAAETLAFHMDREEEERDVADTTRPLYNVSPERHYIDGYIEYDHYIGNLEVFNPNVSRVKWQIDKDAEVPTLDGVPVSVHGDNREYRRIELDKTIKDMSFDKESTKLVILTVDESVLEFKLGNARTSHCDLKSLSQLRRNGGYYLAPAQQRVLEISKLVATPISDDGTLNLVTSE